MCVYDITIFYDLHKVQQVNSVCPLLTSFHTDLITLRLHLFFFFPVRSHSNLCLRFPFAFSSFHVSPYNSSALDTKLRSDRESFSKERNVCRESLWMEMKGIETFVNFIFLIARERCGLSDISCRYAHTNPFLCCCVFLFKYLFY